jgi:3-deoxy-7-phosphoheptulonate synthase
MRVYFEKPRTTVGWKGLLNDPNLDGTYQINKGLRIGRKLMVDLTEMGVACAVEFLDTISPQFISDLVAWGAIGARTTESQVHRQLASGVSMPVGFKNGTSGDIGIAANAIVSAAAEHCFLGVTKEGGAAIITTSGNPDCHIILRGATTGPNYGPEHVANVKELLAKHKVAPRIMIDCSHDNASKKHENQVIVCKSIAEQISQGDSALMGVMVESNINEGRQDLKDGKNLKYGVSITDACVDLATTEKILSELAQAVQARRAHNRK